MRIDFFTVHSGESRYLWGTEKETKLLFIKYKYLLSPTQQRQKSKQHTSIEAVVQGPYSLMDSVSFSNRV